jgi:hypothetical protein
VDAGYLWSATGLLFLDAGALIGLACQVGDFFG